MIHDYDNPSHASWTDQTLSAFMSNLDMLAEHYLVARCAVFYTTLHGARFVYVLDTPLPVEESEPYFRGMISDAAEVGLTFDAACSDWTRLMRLPYVVRDGVAAAPSVLRLHSERRLNPHLITPLGPVARVGAGPVDGECVGDQPSDAACQALLWANVNGRAKPTAFHKATKKRTEPRPCYGFLFEDQPLPDGPSWNKTINGWVGDVCALTHNVPGATAAHVYAVFLAPALNRLEPASSPGYDWPGKIWGMCCRWWSAETGKALAAEQATVRDASTLTLGVLGGMKLWCDHAALLQADEGAATAWSKEHLIACCGSAHYIMTPDGRYDGLAVGENKIASRVRELGMANLIQLETWDAQGNKKLVSPTALVSMYGTNVASVRGRVGDAGGRIENIRAETAALIVKTFALRTDIAPTYHAVVDSWLQHVGGVYYTRLLRWIGLALRFTGGPICALSLVGEPGSGKGLFVKALGECITTREVITAKELFGNFPEGLLHSGIVVVNESWPAVAGNNIGAVFRECIGGDTHRVNQKFKPVVSLDNPLRMVLTANNMSVVNDICGKRDLEPEDRDAIAVRLFHCAIEPGTAAWLKEAGTVGWLGGPAGPAGIVAEHFLWLYHQYAADAGDTRFLMAGGFQPEVTDTLRTLSGSAPIVMETITDMLVRLDRTNRPTPGMSLDQGRLYILNSAVLEHFRAHITKAPREGLTSRNISTVLAGLSACKATVRVLDSRTETGPQQWYEIDTKVLLETARKYGRGCPLLERLVHGGVVTPMPAAPVPQRRGLA